MTELSVPVTPPAVAPWTYDAGFDARWDAWRVKGHHDEEAFARKMKVVGPIVAAVALLALIYFVR